MFGSKVKLDRDLLNQCRQHAKAIGYSSVEEFITHTMEKELEKGKDKPEKADKDITKQLKGLGYIS